MLDGSNHVLRLYFFAGGIVHALGDIEGDRFAVITDLPVCADAVSDVVLLRIPLEKALTNALLQGCGTVQLVGVNAIPLSIHDVQRIIIRMSRG